MFSKTRLTINYFLLQIGHHEVENESYKASLHPVNFHKGEHESFKNTIHNLFHGTKEDELNTNTCEVLQLDLGVKENRLKAAEYFEMPDWEKVEDTFSKDTMTGKICDQFYSDRWDKAFRTKQEALALFAVECQHRLLMWISAWCNSKYTESHPKIASGSLDSKMFLEAGLQTQPFFRKQKQKFAAAMNQDFKDICERILVRRRDDNYSPLLSTFGATVILLNPTDVIKDNYGDGMSAQNLLTLLRGYREMCKLDKSQSGFQTLMDSVSQVVEMINNNTPHTANTYEPEYSDNDFDFCHGMKLNIKEPFNRDEFTDQTYQDKFPDPAYFAWEEVKDYLKNPKDFANLNSLQQRLLAKAHWKTKAETGDSRHPNTSPGKQNKHVCLPYMHTLESIS